MPLTKPCSFCGAEIEPGTGKMYVLRDGTIHFFGSGKCQKNFLKLKRIPLRTRWTRTYALTRAKVAGPAKELSEADLKPLLAKLTKLPGVTPKIGRALLIAGFKTPEDVRKATLEDLSRIPEVGDEIARRIKRISERTEEVVEAKTRTRQKAG